MKILHQIEEGDSSHVNQAFDREVAKSGKAAARETPPLVIRHKLFGPSEHLDQWQLLVIAAHAVRELAKKPDIWVRSFKATNMHPDYRLSFDDWMIKISDFVTRGGKYEDEGEISAASLLPAWYRNWPDSRKQAAKKLIDEKGWGGVEVLRELCELTSLTPANVAKYQTCYFVECRRGEAACTDPPQRPTSGKVVVDPNRSLPSFQLFPEGMKGLELFQHLCRFRSRRMPPPKMQHDFGLDHLDLDIKEVQFALLQPAAADLSVGQIMRDCASSSASQKMPERKLNVLGEINAYSVMANDPDRVARMKSHLQLAATINSYKVWVVHPRQREEADGERNGGGFTRPTRHQNQNRHAKGSGFGSIREQSCGCELGSPGSACCSDSPRARATSQPKHYLRCRRGVAIVHPPETGCDQLASNL